MAKYFSIVNKPETTATNAGEKVMPKRIHRVTKTGADDLEIVGYTDIYEARQIEGEECAIENILRKYVNGDTEVLNKSPGLYVDLTEVPKNIHEAHDLVVRAESEYKLHPELQERYGSCEEYLEACKFGVPKQEEKIETVEVNNGGGETNE